MTIKEILSGESANVEYKVQRPEKSSRYLKTVIAFANGRGGRLVFGVDDETRAVIGVPDEILFQEMDALANAIADSCEPLIIPVYFLIFIHKRSMVKQSSS